jgi:hypothetical protein
MTTDTPTFPAAELNWLYGLDDKYRIQAGNNSAYKVYPADLLPPSVRKWVKRNYRDTEYVNMGPWIGASDGLFWLFWGWNSLPIESGVSTCE